MEALQLAEPFSGFPAGRPRRLNAGAFKKQLTAQERFWTGLSAGGLPLWNLRLNRFLTVWGVSAGSACFSEIRQLLVQAVEGEGPGSQQDALRPGNLNVQHTE